MNPGRMKDNEGKLVSRNGFQEVEKRRDQILI